MRTLKAVIFDMDGVIADTMNLHYLANKHIANELGLSLSEKENNTFKGISRLDVIKKLCKRANVNISEVELLELSDRKNNYYQNLLENISEKDLLEGIVDFIKGLKKEGIKLAVASSSTNAKTVLKKTGVLSYFDYVVDSSTLKKGKPDPEIFLLAADNLGIDYKNCVAIEDGSAGLLAIKHTPMFSIGVGDDPYMKQADYHVTSTKDLSVEELKKRFSSFKKYVLGVDGGGTNTRVTIMDEDKNVLVNIKQKTGASPLKNTNAKRDVQKAIKHAVEKANLSLSNISSCVLGIADLNNEKDLTWAREFTDIEHLHAIKYHVNDTIVAGFGAFSDNTGIIAVSGTGSMVTGFTEEGQVFSNREHFNHDARAGAVKLSIDTLKRLLEEKYIQKDKAFLNEVFSMLGVTSLEEIKNNILLKADKGDSNTLMKIATLCPIIIQYASERSEPSLSACISSMKELARGVDMVGSTFQSKEIKVCLIGSVGNQPFMAIMFQSCLFDFSKRYTLVKPAFTPEIGACLFALKKLHF